MRERAFVDRNTGLLWSFIVKHPHGDEATLLIHACKRTGGSLLRPFPHHRSRWC